ncbi:prolyl 4-hydroxylase subunit alpha-1-like [Ruditapes philippinarum]|uniref:prolyl 4-hydroxylase subunit alpha-1-like n=1 Tax=Ruditapes philippinarum TaxID=129788 RepID=UPI00295C0A9A|nr:prolyl 4-hydroxylase subunit alpha-1-like [Ruditapes philippinarum]
MCSFILCLVFIINILPTFTSLEEDIFCSSEHLHQAMLEGSYVLRRVNVTKIPLKKTRDKINRFRFDIGFYKSLSEKWTDGMARHPIYIYSMVRDLYSLRILEKNLPHMINVDNLPTKEDLEGTMSALIRLQYTYGLKVAEMAAGIIAGETSMSLSAEDCLLIGAQAHKEKKHECAIEWLNQALIVNSTRTKTLKAKIYSIKCKCESRMGMRTDALMSVTLWLKNDKDSIEAIEWRDKILNMPDRRNYNVLGDDMQNYITLCRGEMTKESYNSTIMSKLHCRFYDNNRHPLLVLQPARQEDVRDDPHMKIYHDVILDGDIKVLKAIAKPKIKVSKVLKKVSSSKMKSSTAVDLRVSKGYGITDTDPTYIKVRNKLFNRVQAITGFYSKSNEALQVANYGIGGYYSPHYDWSLLHADPMHNDRIGTFLFYLNEVVAGGATVFPRIGVRVAPKKGDAVFWHNLQRNGTGNEKTFHAGCPVLLGTKWISNLWIRRHHQEFVQPCTLNEYE